MEDNDQKLLNTNTMLPEKPLVVLKPKKYMFWLFVIFIVYSCFFNMFGVILPVLITGDYSSVWPASDKRTIMKIALFYIGWVYFILLPTAFRGFNNGKLLFYKDRLVVKPYLFKKERVYFYDSIIVNCYGDFRIALYSNSLHSCKSTFQRFKVKYLQGLGFGLSPRCFDNSPDVEKALELLKNSVSEFNIKPLS